MCKIVTDEGIKIGEFVKNCDSFNLISVKTQDHVTVGLTDLSIDTSLWLIDYE